MPHTCSRSLTFPHQTPGNQDHSNLHRTRLSLPARRRGRHLLPPRRRRHKGLPRRQPDHPQGPRCRRPGHHPGVRVPLRGRRLRPVRRRSRPALCRPQPGEHRAVWAETHGAGASPRRWGSSCPGDAGPAGGRRRCRARGGGAGVPRHAQVDGRRGRHGPAGVWGRGPAPEGV